MSENYLVHHGKPGQKWGKRNGPPYPLDAAGKEAFKQQRKEERAKKKEERANRESEKNYKVGSERLHNRINTVNKNAQTDKLAAKAGWNSTYKSGEAHRSIKNVKQISEEILSDRKRTEALGKATRVRKSMAVALTSTSVAASIAAGTLVVAEIGTGGLLVPITASAASIAIGKEYIDSLRR